MGGSKAVLLGGAFQARALEAVSNLRLYSGYS